MRTSAVLVALVAVQQAAATGSWNDAQMLPSCSQAPNQCTDQQKQGLDLTNAQIPEGKCNSYAGFDLQGLSYGSFGGKGKRDLFSRNGGSSSKCLQGSIGKSSSVGITCGSSIPNKKASISNMQVSVDKDTPVLFTHSYEGSDETCSYVKSCSASSVNSVDNSQCGGSSSVECSVHSSSPHDTCNIGVLQINYDCTPGQQSSSPVSPPQTQKTVSPPKSNSPPKGSAPYPKPSVPASSAPVGTAPVPSVPVGTAPVPSAPTSSAPAPSVPATSAGTPSQGATTSPTANEAATTSPVPVSTVEQVTSEVVSTTVTSSPVPKTVTEGGSTTISVVTELSTTKVTSTMTMCTKCVAPPQKTESEVAPPPAPVGSAPPASEAASTAPAASSPAPAPSSAAPAPSSAAPAPSVTPVPSQEATKVPAASSAPPAPPAVPQTTQAIVTTEIVYTTLTTCPVTHTITPSSGPPTQQVTTIVSTIISTITSTICTQCIAPQKSVAPPPPASSAPAPAPPAQVGTTVVPPASSAPPATPNVPSVLPRCLKTWVTVTKCKDNSDYDCFCKNDQFTQSVYECITAWEADNAQQQAAISFYAGICAQHVPAHPVIVTAVPSTITLVPCPAGTNPAGSAPAVNSPAPTAAPAAVPASVAPAAPAPAQAGVTAPPQVGLPPTTIFLSTTIALPCPSATAVGEATDGQVQAAATPMTGGCTTTSLLQIAITVPQVALSTGPSSSVCLVAGTPAPAQAAATAPAGVPSVAAASSSAPVAKPTGATPFTGAASKSSVSMIFAAAVAGLFVLA